MGKAQFLHFGRRRLPLILQAEQSECGLACLAMVLGYHGHRIDLASLRARCGVTALGANLKTLLHMADRLRLCGRPLKLEVEELPNLQLPAVLHWDLRHFVVLKRAGPRRALIHDPAVGEVAHDYRSLGRHFSGVALELLPGADFAPRDEERRLRLRELWTRCEGLAGALVQLFLLSLLLQLFALALPFYTQLFVDDVLVNRDFTLLEILAAGFLMITLIKCLTELLRAYVVLHLCNRLSFQFAVNVFRHLLRLPLDYFAKRHMGDIVSRFGSLDKVRDFLCSGLVEVAIDGLMVAAVLSLMFVYSPLLTWVALAAVGLYGLLRLALQRAWRRRSEELIHGSALEKSQFMENVRAIQGIKLFGKESERLAGWQNSYAEVINAGIRLQKLGIAARFAHGLLVGAGNILLMLLGGRAVLDGQLSVGMIIAYFSFKDQLYARVFALLDKLFELRLLDVHLSRLADIAHARPERHAEGGGASAESAGGDGLRACGLAFRYGEDAPWLFRRVELEIGPEEAVALIGPTGCGKSTLLRLLCGLLQPAEGQVFLDGVPVNAMGLTAYRRRIGVVLQDDSLLSGSIFDNISFFDPRPDRERVEGAARLAAVADDIRAMPMQYDTLVGDMGAALSGGQAQRLLLARALYRRPRLLMLDEATSHLDLATERAVSGAVQDMKIARLIVAHRPQTILLADRILRLTPEGLEPVSHTEFRDRHL